MSFLVSEITHMEALSKHKLSSEENGSVTHCMFSEDLSYTPSISWGNVKGENFRNPTNEGSSHTPDAHRQCQHTAVTLFRVALSICELKYLSTNIQLLLTVLFAHFLFLSQNTYSNLDNKVLPPPEASCLVCN